MSGKMLRVAAAMAALALCAGCVGVNFTVGGSETVVGKGSLVKKEYNVGSFTAVEIHSDMDLYYTAGQSDTITIELQENLVEYLDVLVTDGVLIIQSDKRLRVDGNQSMKLYISAPMLERIAVSGAIDIVEADPIKADSFVLDISGACSGDLTLDVQKLNAKIAGAAYMTLAGSAPDTSINVSGASSLDALGLQTKHASVTVNGAGNLEIACSDTLDVTVNGTGSVSYKGDPSVSKSIAGAASVTKLD